MHWNKAIVMATAAAVASSPFMLTTPAMASDRGPATIQAKDDLAPLLKTRQLIAGDTWRQTVKVKGYKQIKLQVKSGSGPFRTVKSYKVPKSGKVKLSWTFSKPGRYSLRSIAIREGAGRDVKSRPVIITAVARQYKGTFGGTHTSGTSWNATITYQYQERDPYTNGPWGDGLVHYAGIDGTLTWSFDASVLNADTGIVGVSRRNCIASPNTGQVPVTDLSAFVTVDSAIDRTYKGSRYEVNATMQSPPRIDYTCDYLEEDLDGNPIWVSETRDLGLQFGPNMGDLLTNSLSVAATGVGGQYTSSLSAPLVGDINRPGEAITNRWYWNLAAG